MSVRDLVADLLDDSTEIRPCSPGVRPDDFVAAVRVSPHSPFSPGGDGETHSPEVPGCWVGDDRRACHQCENLTPGGRCLAAERGELVATARRYAPPLERLHRCEGYVPGAADPDRRPGRERWSSLLTPNLGHEDRS